MVVSFVVQILVWNELPDQVKPSHPIYVMKTVKCKQYIQLVVCLKTTLIVFVIIDFPIFRNQLNILLKIAGTLMVLAAISIVTLEEPIITSLKKLFQKKHRDSP
jgi:hypothetical protein